MPDTHDDILRLLIERGIDLHKKPRELVTFTLNPDADTLLNSIEAYPHFFVLGCIMDRQNKGGEGMADSLQNVTTSRWRAVFRILKTGFAGDNQNIQ